MTLPPSVIRALLFLSALTLVFVFGVLGSARANTAAEPTTAPTAVPTVVPVSTGGNLMPQQLYGPEIAFDVYRNGEKIGWHRTRFEQERGALIVRAQMNIAVEVLFFTAYRYSYESTARWSNESLDAIEVTVDDDGTRIAISARKTDRGLVINGPKGQMVADPPIFPTNHWHPGVLAQNRVLNTVNGEIDEVTISPKGPDTVKTGTGSRDAWEYAYSGGFDASVWYDAQGRWVKLKFNAKDGSKIEYVCRKCGAGDFQSVSTE